MKLIRTLLLSITACALLIPVILGFLFFLAIEKNPRVEQHTVVTPEHIERARHVFDQHRHDNLQNEPATIHILSEDINIAANYLVKLFTHGKARVNLSSQQAEIHISLPLPLQSIEGYINFQAVLTETAALPQLQSVRIGALAIPDFVSQFLTTRFAEWLTAHSRYSQGVNIIRNIRFTSETLVVAHRWPDSLNKSNGYNLPVLSKSEQNRIYLYHLFLVQNSHQQHSKKPTQTNQELSQILQPLMQMAAKHSKRSPASVENRAAIFAATFHVLGLPLEHLIPDAINWPRAKHQTITLDGRQDFAQHFIVSAAITAYADTFLSDAIGLYKEIEDARSGSGFSFNDIAADRAGTAFGERATTNHTTAVKLQQWVAQGITDKDLMPVWIDLPEHLPKPVFRQQFGQMDTPAYEQMMKKIEQRVSALPFLQ